MAKIVGIGIATLDIINYVSHYPHEDEELRADAQRINRGGNVTNSLSVLSQLNHQCYWIGTLCNDNDAKYIVDDLKKFGINHSFCQNMSTGKIPTSYITINNQTGSRTIVHFRDLPELSYTHFSLLNLDNIDWFHFEARAIEETEKMIQHVKQNYPNAIISVEIEKQREQLSNIYNLAHLYLFSKHFANVSGFEDAETFLQQHKAFNPGADLICGWGEKGAYALLKNGELLFSPAFPPQKIVDTLGAGDTFNAALISARIDKINWPEALQFACRLAGKKCGQTGFDNLV